MSTDARGRTYSSIFLSPDWAHQKHFGWRVAAEEPGLRVLTKRHSIIRRHLIMLTRGGELAAADYIERVCRPSALSDIVVHDFNAVSPANICFSGRTFRMTAQRERLLNVATFVVDLKCPEDAILAGMSSDYRRKIRKAEAAGVTVQFYSRPSSSLRNSFAGAFRALAAERALQPIDPVVLEAMYAAGDAILVVARKHGETTNYLHLYRAGCTGFFMYGVNLVKENDGAGQYLHFAIMRRLKADGLSWYDLGGVASCDPTDGIYTFKKKFGGHYVDLGMQWRWTGSAAKLAARAPAMLRRLRARR